MYGYDEIYETHLLYQDDESGLWFLDGAGETLEFEGLDEAVDYARDHEIIWTALPEDQQ